MTSIGLAGAALVAAIPGLAPAQDSAAGLTQRGYVELEYLADGDDDDLFLTGDLALSFGGAVVGSMAGLGVDLGLVALSDGDNSYSAPYAALTWGFGQGKLSFGIPRSAYGTFGKAPPLGGMRVLQLELDTLSGSIAEQAYLLGDADTPLGLRYDGDYGALAVAASAQRFDSDDVDAFALALRYQVTSNVSALADWEQVLTPGGNLDTTRVGGEWAYGAWESGLAYFNRDPNFGTHVDGTETWVTYRPTDRISVTGSAFNTNVVDVYGASLRYDWPVGVYGQIGVADGRSLDTMFDLSVGFEF
jgi:hypothetical protein